jgi:hypothetical protein
MVENILKGFGFKIETFSINQKSDKLAFDRIQV